MENQNTELMQQGQGVFSSKESFEHIQRVATMFSKSDMVPKRYINNIGNCIIALDMANRMNANILMVMQNLDVIQGKPGWSSTFLIATVNASGKFSPLRYEESDADGGSTRAWAIDKGGEKCVGAWVSMKMADAEGWISKTGSKWKTMPELMRRYRAASFFAKQFAPEVSMGLQTVEEIIDITPIANYREVKTDEQVIADRLTQLINDCETLEDLYLFQTSNPDVDVKIIEAKKQELLSQAK